jgi:hypothetical protein
MVVVHGLVGFAGVVHDAVPERDATIGQPIGEPEFMERIDAPGGCDLGIPQLMEP